ncbi:MAG: hypothetical protein WAK20_14205 [Candidatus Acidiferrum sp.]
MNQIIYIFRKDVRQHWYVIVLSLASVAAYVRNDPRSWGPEGIRATNYSWLLPLLVVIGWMILIVRAIQGESLVGNCQFWITRPYEWKKLLAAKALFFIAFINVPLFILQFVLLRMAGFAPTSYIKSLLWMQFLWVLILILPITTLATVTSTFGQAVLVVVGIPLCLILLESIPRMFPHRRLPFGVPVLQSLEGYVVVVACLFVVIWQYARRGTLQSRLLLLVMAAVFLFVIPLVPHNGFAPDLYPSPAAGQSLPVQLAFDANRQTAEEDKAFWIDKVGIRIPLLFSGSAENPAARVDGTMVEIEAPGGFHWNSGWQANGSLILIGQPLTETLFGVDKVFFEQMKSSPAIIRISFALTPIRAKEIDRIVAADGEFMTPDGAWCSIISNGERGNFLQCRSPLKPPFIYVTEIPGETTCPLHSDENAIPPGTTFFASVWGAGPAEFGISPVKTFPLSFERGLGKAENYHPELCPGVPLTFSILEETPRTRTELTIEGIRLVDYRLKDPLPSKMPPLTGTGIVAQ